MSKTAEDVVDAVSQLFKCWSCFLHRYLRWWWFQYLTADALRQAVGQPDRFRQAVSDADRSTQSAASRSPIICPTETNSGLTRSFVSTTSPIRRCRPALVEPRFRAPAPLPLRNSRDFAQPIVDHRR